MNKNQIVSTEPHYGKTKKKNGKPVKIGTRLINKDGEFNVVLTPAGKGAKFASELKNNKRYYNKGTKVKAEGLTDTQRAYRAGYLDARKDNAKVYTAKNNKK